jgi:hypothetical protein
MTNISAPSVTETIEQFFTIEPLGGPTHPYNLLDRFPDELYDKSPDSHFVRLMYAILGASGVGWLKKNLLDARLKLFEQGFDTFDIERYYGDPFRFGRVLLEVMDEDPSGLLTREQWDTIKSKDESYRNRAITFFNAARAGNTPEGMKLAAQSGLNHAAEIIENYKYLFDLHTDQPLSLPYYGSTLETEEFIVLPRREDSATEIQLLSFEDATIVSGGFLLKFREMTTGLIDFDADHFTVQSELRNLPVIGADGVVVSGGPFPNAFIIQFGGPLSNQNVPQIEALSSMSDNLGKPKDIFVTTQVGGVNIVDEVVQMSDEYAHNMQSALDFLRPVNTIPTTYSGQSSRERLDWKGVTATSEYAEVVKLVTGSEDIQWPDPDSLNWVEPGKEKEAKRIKGDLQAHYVAYHTLSGVTAYTDDALDDADYATLTSILDNYNSEHVGKFDPALANSAAPLPTEVDDTFVFKAAQAVPPCASRVEVTVQDPEGQGRGGIEGTIFSIENGFTKIPYKTLGWVSLSRPQPATDYLEIDMGRTVWITFIEFDAVAFPFQVDISYDTLGTNDGSRAWQPVTPMGGGSRFDENIPFDTTKGVYHFSSNFLNQKGKIITSRYLRLGFTRQDINAWLAAGVDVDPLGILVNKTTHAGLPYPVGISNIRLGRCTIPFQTNDPISGTFQEGATISAPVRGLSKAVPLKPVTKGLGRGQAL